MASQALPEPMNSQPHHSKVRVSITLVDPTYVAGTHVGGRLEMECRADKGLGIGIMMVELFAIQELSSRDHSATSTFLHSCRLFQGPTLPPSNAVQAYPMPGDPPLPQHYYQARRGHSTFLFRVPIPATSPSSISFGSGLAKVRYELRASVGVFWKNEKQLVVDKRPIDVVEAYPYDETLMGKAPEAIVVGENGKLWMQGKIMGKVIVAGESACLELQVKNHSAKKNTGLTLTLTRTLYLPGSATGTQRAAPVHISDTLITVPFRGPEYIIPPGAEGVANLVFDVPKHARGVRGGTLDGEEPEGGNGVRRTDSLFEIRCKVEVKLTMGMGSKDVLLEIPVEVIHPNAVPSQQDLPGPFSQHYLPSEPLVSPASYNPYYVPPPVSPVPMHVPYIDPIHNQVWLPPQIPTHTPLGYPYLSYSPAPPDQYQPPSQPYAPHAYYASPPFLSPQQNLLPPSDAAAIHGGYLHRPSSAGPVASASQVPPPVIQGLPTLSHPPYLLPLSQLTHNVQDPVSEALFEPQVGKGDRALRVTQHLRLSSRNRSVSPQSHRYPLPLPPPAAVEVHLQDTFAATAIASSNLGAFSQNVTSPPVMALSHSMSSSAPDANLVHSPRPQLTPKHSFTRDPVLGTTSKSERVEKLEMMADVVARRSRDLSRDLPKEMAAVLSAAVAAKDDPAESAEANVNKTLPGPPVPSGKPLLAPPGRARADLYFAAQNDDLAETVPLPSDQTPPTPALLAVLPSRHRAEREHNLKTESGLDALERRLLAEVGTRKMDVRAPQHKDARLDVRSMLPIDTSVATPQGSSSAIRIPQKSPEPLHDSAISSLTLAGGLEGDDSDGEFDGRTHRAGRSRGGSSYGRGEARGGLHMHMRERAQGGSPTRMERERAREERGKDDSEKQREKGKEGKTSGKKKDRAKSSAKGRVAAWLGGIDPDVPPQEEIIPPSPSVLRDPQETFDPDGDGSPLPQFPPVVDPWAAPGSGAEPPTDTAAPPNPRSSGFVPIATLKRNTIQASPLLLRNTSVSNEAQRIQDIWSSGSPPAVHTTFTSPLAITPVAPSMPIRTDRRVSPPSAKPPAGTTAPDQQAPRPLSYSAAARSKPKTPEPARVQAKSPPPPLPDKSPIRPPGRGRVHAVFPPTKPVDLEVKYDIRSARGGRGGKVTSVANLWSSGALANEAKGKQAASQQRPNPVEGSSVRPAPAPPPKPAPTERKLFSAAVMTPAPPPTPPKQHPPPTSAFGSGASPAAPRTRQDAQKRPDSRAVFGPPKRSPRASPSPRKSASSNALSTPVGGAHAARPAKVGQSAEVLVQTRPATAMALPYALRANGLAPTSASTPAPAVPRGLAAPRARVAPVVKGASDPAVVSSSHAVPTLSSTASLARPQRPVSQKPLGGSNGLTPSATTGLARVGADSSRPASPSKPVDLAFGQARLRDLIKKYQGQGQKS